MKFFSTMSSLLVTLAHRFWPRIFLGTGQRVPRGRLPVSDSIDGLLPAPYNVGKTEGQVPFAFCLQRRPKGCCLLLPPPPPGTDSHWRIKTRPSTHSSHSARQEAKPPAHLLCRTGLWDYLLHCWRLSQREAQPIRKG